MFDSSFLCLDVGTSCVRGIAHRIRNANIDRSAFFSMDSTDTVFAIRTVIDELERQIGAHFDTAYVTGNFGPSEYELAAKNTNWGCEHKITSTDVRGQISDIVPPDGYFPMHIIPLRYYTPHARNLATPIGHIDSQLISAYGAIFYTRDGVDCVYNKLRGAHIQPDMIYDPQFLQNYIYRHENQNTMFIDFGASFTSVSIWTDRGPVWHQKIPVGGKDVTTAIQTELGLDFESAERIKRNVSTMAPRPTDRFAPADRDYGFSRGDVNDISLPILVDIVAKIKEKCLPHFTKYKPTKIILSGGGAEIEGMCNFIENTFAVVTSVLPSDASVRALSEYIWRSQASRRKNYISRHNRWSNRIKWIKKLFNRNRKRPQKFVPILPSTLCFDMRRPETYTLFKSGGISMIHVDIMDGFYVDRVAGNIDEIRSIRAHTNAHLHVHLMTESPNVWAADAVSAGADTVILSTNTSGLRSAIRTVRSAGRRVGIALNPESSVTLLKPIIREIDEVMIMSVAPGASGQTFDTSVLNKISVLNATRQKYGLKFVISVDGGINPETAQMCWDAGANLLISGSYLAHAPDFPLAVHSLMKRTNC